MYLWDIVQEEYKVAENGNTEVKYKYLDFVQNQDILFAFSSWRL